MCPFCEKECIEIIVCKKNQWSPYQGEPDKMVKSKDEIMSEECPNCGKTREEIIRRMRDGNVNSDKIVERLGNNNLPTIITEKF